MPAAVAIPLITGAMTAGAAVGTGIYGANKQGSAARQATQATTASNTKAAELEAQSARDALAFTKQQDALNRAQHATTEALNLDQYNQQGARLQPYRTLGSNAALALDQRMQGGDGRTLLPPPTIRRTLG